MPPRTAWRQSAMGGISLESIKLSGIAAKTSTFASNSAVNGSGLPLFIPATLRRHNFDALFGFFTFWADNNLYGTSQPDQAIHHLHLADAPKLPAQHL